MILSSNAATPRGAIGVGSPPEPPDTGKALDVIQKWFKGEYTAATQGANREQRSSFEQKEPNPRVSDLSAPRSPIRLGTDLEEGQAVNDVNMIAAILQEVLRAAQWNTQLILEDRMVAHQRMEKFHDKLHDSLEKFCEETSNQFLERGREQAALLAKQKHDIEMLFEHHGAHTRNFVEHQFQHHRVHTHQNFQRMHNAFANRSGNGYPSESHSPSPRSLKSGVIQQQERLTPAVIGKTAPAGRDDADMNQRQRATSLNATSFTASFLCEVETPQHKTIDHVVEAQNTAGTAQLSNAVTSNSARTAKASTATGSILNHTTGILDHRACVLGRTGVMLGLASEQHKIIQHVGRMYEAHRLHSGAHICEWFRKNCSLESLRAMGRPRTHQGQESWVRPSKFVELVDGYAFNMCCVSVIVLNAIWIGIALDATLKAKMEQPQTKTPIYVHYVSRAFACVFFAELVLRILILRILFFSRPDRAWNLFDVFVVATTLVEEFSQLNNLSHLRLLRVLRLIRVVRVMRILRYFSGLQALLVASLGSIMTLVWTLMSLAFCVYLFAVLILQGADMVIDDNDADTWQHLNSHYGSVETTMYTLICAVAGGFPWAILAWDLARINFWLAVVFFVYILAMVFGFFNMVTAVFVNQAAELKSQDRDLAIQREMADSHAFMLELKGLLVDDHVVVEGAKLDWHVFKAYMAQLDVQMFLQTHSIDITEAEELFKILEHSKEGYVTIDDFVYGCQRMKGTAKAMDVALLFEEVAGLRGMLAEQRDRQAATARDIKDCQQKLTVQLLERQGAMEDILADLRTSLAQPV